MTRYKVYDIITFIRGGQNEKPIEMLSYSNFPNYIVTYRSHSLQKTKENY